MSEDIRLGAEIHRYYVRLLYELNGWSSQETDQWIDTMGLRRGLEGKDLNFFRETPEFYIITAVIPEARLRKLDPNDALVLRAAIIEAARNSIDADCKSFDNINITNVAHAIRELLLSRGLIE